MARASDHISGVSQHSQKLQLALRPRVVWLFRLILAGGAFAAAALLFASTAWTDGPNFETGAVLVRWGPSAGVRAQESIVSTMGASTVDSIPQLGIYKLRVPPGREREAVDTLKNSGAEQAELNHVRRITLTPNDSYFANQWDMSKIGAPAAWDITTGSSSIIVAVVDTGLDTSHPDRPQNLLLGPDYIRDATGNTPVSDDQQGHGTHVSGTVAARLNNSAGVAGLAPGVTLMSVRVLDQYGSGDTFTAAKGVTYAADHGAKVINLSLAGTETDSTEAAAMNYAASKGALVVAAAGNCYAGGAGCDSQINPTMYPAALPNVIAVGSTGSGDAHAYYSETGNYVDLAAPGGGASSPSDQIYSTCKGSNYCYKIGTSMAAPHVAALAALVWSVNPNLTADQVHTIMRQTAVDLGTAGRDDTFGYGRIDVYQALRQAQGTLGYSAQFVSQSFPSSQMYTGQPFTATVTVKNTGGTTWQRDGASPTRLGTSLPTDRSSPFYTSGNWLSPTRPARLTEASVASGQNGTFTFVLTPPSSAGIYAEHYKVVVEGNSWLDQPDLWFTVTVLPRPLTNKLYLPLATKGASGW